MTTTYRHASKFRAVAIAGYVGAARRRRLDFAIKLLRAYGECLGARRRRRT